VSVVHLREKYATISDELVDHAKATTRARGGDAKGGALPTQALPTILACTTGIPENLPCPIEQQYVPRLLDKVGQSMCVVHSITK